MANGVAKKESGVVALRNVLSNPNVKKQFEDALKESAGLFMASIMDLVSSDKTLQDCKPQDIVREALKAAVLKLPLNKQLGFAYLVPFKEKGIAKPVFVIGYKGLIQLAIRTGQYKHINAGEVYDGEAVERDRITGDITIKGTPKSDKVVGYFAYIELVNGFKKLIYKTKDEILKHAEKYSKSFKSDYSPWKTDFDKMARKTLLRELIGTYGIKSVEYITVEAEDIESNSVEEETITVIPEEEEAETVAEDKPETKDDKLEPGF